MDISFLHISALTLLGAAAILGFYMGRAAVRLSLPSIIGYMLLGVILGPSVLNVFNEAMMKELSFLTETALGFVAFSIGSELSISSLKRIGGAIISIIIAESFLAFFAVTAALYILTGDMPLSIIFGAMAPASAPAGTVAVIQENKASGDLTKALYAVVGFDDGLAIIIYGFAVAIAKKMLVREASHASLSILPAIWTPVMEIGLSFLMGGVIGLLFCLIVSRLHKSQDIFIIVFGVILLATGLAVNWHLSLILASMMVGFVLANSKHETFVLRVKQPLLEIMPLVYILFFTLAGAHLNVDDLAALGLIGVVYIAARSAGLIGGARLGAQIGGAGRKIKKYLGLGILSQAGVAIGLSLIAKELGQLDF